MTTKRAGKGVADSTRATPVVPAAVFPVDGRAAARRRTRPRAAARRCASPTCVPHLLHWARCCPCLRFTLGCVTASGCPCATALIAGRRRAFPPPPLFLPPPPSPSAPPAVL